jgi:excisionase family DNA binding protein
MGARQEMGGIDDVAAMLGVSVRHAESLHAEGGIPGVVRFGRCRRWHLGTVRQWLEQLAADGGAKAARGPGRPRGGAW